MHSWCLQRKYSTDACGCRYILFIFMLLFTRVTSSRKCKYVVFWQVVWKSKFKSTSIAGSLNFASCSLRWEMFSRQGRESRDRGWIQLPNERTLQSTKSYKIMPFRYFNKGICEWRKERRNEQNCLPTVSIFSFAYSPLRLPAKFCKPMLWHALTYLQERFTIAYANFGKKTE